MLLKKSLILLSALSLSACVTAPKQDYTHIPYDSTQSKAYNIAKQTSLGKDFWYGKTIKSPLKDFTQAEIDSAETSLRAYRGGDVSLGNGLLSIATGDLTGLISVAGGAAANLAQSDHTPSNQVRVLVELPSNQFNSPVEAERFIVDSMSQASKTVLAEYGEVERTAVKFDSNKIVHMVKHGDSVIPFGAVMNKADSVKGDKLAINSQSLTGDDGQYFTYGVEGHSGLYANTSIATAPVPFVYSVEVSAINTLDFYQAFSAQLPEGFYVYVPSFPHTSFNGKTYIDNSVIVPSIFDQGKQYQFLAQ